MELTEEMETLEDIVQLPNDIQGTPKRILYLSLERNVELEKYHTIQYLDYKMIQSLGKDGTMELINRFKPQIVLEREFNDQKSIYDDLVKWIKTNNPSILTAVWLIDTHCNYARHVMQAKNYDYVFLAISKFIPEFEKINKNTFWLPLCYPERSDSIKRNKGKVTYDIVFCGNSGGMFVKRTEYLNALKEHFGDRLLWTRDYENMSTLLRESVVSFNCSLGKEMNFRVWETMAQGVELVTDDVDDLFNIKDLPDKIHLYQTQKQAIQKIEYILNGKLERDVIKNQIWVKNHHCLIHRHLALLKMISTGEQLNF